MASFGGTLEEKCAKWQDHNRKLKAHVAKTDAESARQAMNGGLTGIGCDDPKLIAAICGRTKSQLRHTSEKFRELFDRDLRSDVKSESGGSYGKMMWYALAPPEVYVADAIDAATKGMGCNETALLELLVTQSNAQMAAGRECWEGRADKSLVDYLNSQLGHDYRHLRALLLELLKGHRDEGTGADEGAIPAQVEALHKECSKGMLSDFKEDVVIATIANNNATHNHTLAQAYETEHSKSLSMALKKKCGKRFHQCLDALLMTKADFVARRLNDAMKGWGADKGALARLMGGLDGDGMADVCSAFERKYGRPLKSALIAELSGNIERASTVWVSSLQDPSRGLEAKTEADVGAIAGDEAALQDMLQALQVEYESLMTFAARLDAERITAACKGFFNNDTKLISTLAPRSKPHFARVDKAYRAGPGLSKNVSVVDFVSGATSGWYKYLLQFIMRTEPDSDIRLLDLAMDGLGSNGYALVEFLCARSPARIRTAKAAWEARHDTSLVDRLVAELTGDMETFALVMLKGERDMFAHADGAEAEAQAEALHAAGEARRLGTDEKAFIELMSRNSPAQNWALARAYENAYGGSLMRAIRKEFGGVGERNIRNALLSLLQDPVDWYAARLKDAFSGWGTTDRAVCRILGSNDKSTCVKIAAAFERKYGEPLSSAIKKECSGNYKRLLIAWVTMPDELAELPDEPFACPEEMEDEEEKAAGEPGVGEAGDEDETEETALDAPPQPLGLAASSFTPQKMVVTCPAGSGAGDKVLVSKPDGSKFMVTIPDGVGPYQQFFAVLPAIFVPPAPPAAAAEDDGENEDAAVARAAEHEAAMAALAAAREAAALQAAEAEHVARAAKEERAALKRERAELEAAKEAAAAERTERNAAAAAAKAEAGEEDDDEEEEEDEDDDEGSHKKKKKSKKKHKDKKGKKKKGGKKRELNERQEKKLKKLQKKKKKGKLNDRQKRRLKKLERIKKRSEGGSSDSDDDDDDSSGSDPSGSDSSGSDSSGSD